ncbi:hypothetical protein Goklo_008335 [Gossypium klotzschianum]|uniref:RNase H type-1 domain-containing protein n=1 Tax=Gossypium klotzschianum TaxID=34286 RepID=A0A7J8UZG7_9ROSI|nr:hypothetical protein [Gossypium klotzschianum]
MLKQMNTTELIRRKSGLTISLSTDMRNSRGHAFEACEATPCSILSENGAYLNTNGLVRHEDGFAAVAGIVRDHNGKWLFEFNRGYDNVIIQFDSFEVVKDIQEGFIEGSNSALIRRIHQLLLRFGRWSICHIHREDNQDADRLVKMVYERNYELLMFEGFSFGGRS